MTSVAAVPTVDSPLYRLDDGRRIALLPDFAARVWLAQAGLTDDQISSLISDADYEARRQGA